MIEEEIEGIIHKKEMEKIGQEAEIFNTAFKHGLTSEELDELLDKVADYYEIEIEIQKLKEITSC